MPAKFNAGDLCNRIVAFATREMSVEQAAKLMRQHRVGCLVVVDETLLGRAVVGLLTDRDIATAVVAMSLDPAALRVEDVMSAEVVTARTDDSVDDLLGTMRHKGVRRLPVTTAQGVLVGLLTLDDLLQLLAEQINVASAVVKAGQAREHSRRA